MYTLRTLCERHTCGCSELDGMHAITTGRSLMKYHAMHYNELGQDEKDAYELKALAVRGDRLASLRSQIAHEEQVLDGLSIQGSHACEDASM
eukprot:5622026-Amphidinium_carterae.1